MYFTGSFFVINCWEKLPVDRAGESEAVGIGQGCFKISLDLILIDHYAVNEIVYELLAVLAVTRSYPLGECAYHRTKHFLIYLGIDLGLRNTVTFFFEPCDIIFDLNEIFKKDTLRSAVKHNIFQIGEFLVQTSDSIVQTLYLVHIVIVLLGEELFNTL